MAFCTQCGAPLQGNFCVKCGATASAAPDAQTVNPYAQGAATNFASNVYGGVPKIEHYLVGNILVTILLNPIFGIIGIIFSTQSIAARDRGDYETALAKAKIARTMYWISLGLLFLGVALLVIVAVVNS